MNMKILGGVACAILFFTSSARAGVDLEISDVPNDAPFELKAVATATELIVDIKLEPEWHVYCRDVGGGQPVSLTTDISSRIIATGEMALPRSESGKLTGAVQIRLPIGLGVAGDSRYLDGRLQLQVCDALMCLPPMEIRIRGEVPALQVLLVVGEEDDRTARIVDWLESHGFAITTTTYADVDKADCDANDVVLADSNVFGKTKAGRDHVLGFPKSETPLIAVGFNGTSLVEAHEIAMTSGYI